MRKPSRRRLPEPETSITSNSAHAAVAASATAVLQSSIPPTLALNSSRQCATTASLSASPCTVQPTAVKTEDACLEADTQPTAHVSQHAARVCRLLGRRLRAQAAPWLRDPANTPPTASPALTEGRLSHDHTELKTTGKAAYPWHPPWRSGRSASPRTPAPSAGTAPGRSADTRVPA